ncbi:MAG: hypothetical protein ACP6IP_10800 [Candidatus Njordarchaeia archaeon]
MSKLMKTVEELRDETLKLSKKRGLNLSRTVEMAIAKTMRECLNCFLRAIDEVEKESIEEVDKHD